MDWLRYLDRLGVAVGYPVALVVVELAISARRAPVVGWASTNADNLRHHPVGSMVGSAFVAESAPIGLAVLGAVGLASVGWTLGSWRTGLLVFAAHVLATLGSEALYVYRTGDLHAVDVGPSYVVVAALAAGIAYGPWPGRIASALGFAVAFPELFGGLLRLDLSATGHGCSVVVAVAFGALLRRSTRVSAPG
jgi:hypothetical protein